MGKSEHKEGKEHKKHKRDKKKRDEDDGAADGSTAAKKCRVELQPPSASDMPAVACYFPAGQAPEGASYTLYETGPTAKPQYTLLGTKDKISYVGNTQGEEYAGVQANMCSQAIGVYNKATGQLQLLPMAGGRVLRMEPRLPGLTYDHQGEQNVLQDDGPETREQLMAENKRLVDSFGSTRRRRQLVAREEGIVRVDKLGDGASVLTTLLVGLGQQAEEQGISKQQVLAQANAHRHLPPHNLDGTTPESAYPASSIIPPDVASSLNTRLLIGAAKGGEAMQELEAKKSSNAYILSRVSVLREGDLPVIKHRAKLLAFLSVLMRLRIGRPTLVAPAGDGGLGEGMSSLARNLGTSPDVLQPLLGLFYTPSTDSGSTRYSRSKAGETLLQAYICVVALLLEPGAFLAGAHVEHMASELKMSVQDLVQRFREVGAECKPVKVSQEDSEGGAAAGTRSYSAALLFSREKTLKQCLPAIKMAARAAKK